MSFLLFIALIVMAISMIRYLPLDISRQREAETAKLLPLQPIENP